jgi:hypothetical protein
MRIFKSHGSTKINQSSETDIAQDIEQLTRTTFRPENRNDEMSNNDLGARFRRLTETSTREVDGLIEQLQELRKKLHSDRDVIQDYFARYEGLSEGVFQLATIISDNVKRLPPGARDIGHQPDSPNLVAEAAAACAEPVSLSSEVTANREFDQHALESL